MGQDMDHVSSQDTKSIQDDTAKSEKRGQRSTELGSLMAMQSPWTKF